MYKPLSVSWLRDSDTVLYCNTRWIHDRWCALTGPCCVRTGDLHFTMFDMSGQAKYRNLWEHYYTDTDAVIFVVDSADAVRMCVVKDELNTILAHKGTR